MINKSQILSLSIVIVLMCALILGGIILASPASEISFPESSVTDYSIFSDASDGIGNESILSEPSEEPSLPQSDASEEPATFPASLVDGSVKSEYVLLYDVTNDKILFDRNGDKLCYPASITKLLTALTAVEYLKPDDVVVVGDEIKMIGQGSSTAWLQVGYQMTFEQLLDAMLIPSGNDAAYVMGVWVGRIILADSNASKEQALSVFMNRVNEKAVSLGMENTHFTVPDGYHDDNHYTTARDIAIMCKAALNNSFISNSCQKTTASYRLASGHYVKYDTTNVYLKNYAYATGLKTGTTDEAGPCLAASAEKDGVELVAVILNSQTKTSRYTEAATLFDIAYEWVEE